MKYVLLMFLLLVAIIAKAEGKYEGSRKGLIILAEFSDVHFTMEDAQSTYNDIANKVDYKEGDFVGSVHDYFYDQSNGKFDLTFDVVGPVLLSQPMAFYGFNLQNVAGYDTNVATMVKEAVEAVDTVINFSDYDWDRDGEVEQVFILYAGYGEVYGGPAESIWPHKSRLSLDPSVAKAVSVDDGALRVDTYACSCELGGSSGAQLSGIGAFCHEFSHCLGLPDLNGNGFGMNSWSIMDSGSFVSPR